MSIIKVVGNSSKMSVLVIKMGNTKICNAQVKFKPSFFLYLSRKDKVSSSAFPLQICISVYLPSSYNVWSRFASIISIQISSKSSTGELISSFFLADDAVLHHYLLIARFFRIYKAFNC